MYHSFLYIRGMLFLLQEQPPPLRASGNKVLIKFVTDGFHTAPGFRLLYTS